MLRRSAIIVALTALPLTMACGSAASAPDQPVDRSTTGATGQEPRPNGESAPEAEATAATKGETRNPISKLLSREPEYREVTVPAGTVLPVELESSVASDTSRVEDPVRGTLRRAIVVDGIEVVPAGSTLSGAVTSAQRSARVKGRARVAFRFDTLHARDERIAVRTAAVARIAPATKRHDAAKIGAGAGAGAIIGGIVGGGDGAAKGAVIGGAGGTGVVLATRGKEVRLPAGTNVTVKLAAPVTIRVPAR